MLLSFRDRFFMFICRQVIVINLRQYSIMMEHGYEISNTSVHSS